MKITDVRVKRMIGDEKGRLKAYVDLTFDEAFVIHGVKLIEGENGKFIAMPSRKMPDGEFKDIVHPIFTLWVMQQYSILQMIPNLLFQAFIFFFL